MRILLSAMGIGAALLATAAYGQPLVNLTGTYRCVQVCRMDNVGGLAHITQYGWNLNIVNEAGEASPAWVNWPGRIWVQNANEGAIYSPDGLTIQFDHGAIWERVVEPPPPPLLRRRG